MANERLANAAIDLFCCANSPAHFANGKNRNTHRKIGWRKKMVGVKIIGISVVRSLCPLQMVDVITI